MTGPCMSAAVDSLGSCVSCVAQVDRASVLESVRILPGTYEEGR